MSTAGRGRPHRSLTIEVGRRTHARAVTELPGMVKDQLDFVLRIKGTGGDFGYLTDEVVYFAHCLN
jgi:hypothetical protein